jgi:23S rRNA pseudouridine1911/1915/1917 synthase
MSDEFYDKLFVVEPNYDGWRLDHYLCEKIQRLSRTRAQYLIKNNIECERPLKPSTAVFPGLKFVLRRRVREEPPTTDLPATVLYRDADVIAVDKPPGLPMHPTARYFQSTLVARLREMTGPGEKIDPAHRIDRETSGIVVCGLRPEVTIKLKAAFENGHVKKAYLAIVEGHPSWEKCTIDEPLSVGGEVVRIKVEIDRAEGKEAITDAECVARYQGPDGTAFSLVRARPRTGRQHQIRAHLSHAGFPLVGDKIYGPDETFFVRFTEHALDDAARARLRLPRHALHAAELELVHPTTKKILKIESPLPEDLSGFLATLKHA